MQVHDTISAPLKQMDQRPLGLRAERRAQELEVWGQIRRTGEEFMEIGTMKNALLQDHCIQTDGTGCTAAGLSKIGA